MSKGKARRSGGNRTSPQTTKQGNAKHTSETPSQSMLFAGTVDGMEMRPAREVLPSMRYERDFWVFDHDGSLTIKFRRCPLCGREGRPGMRMTIIEFDHPSVQRPIPYAIDFACGMKIANQHARASEDSNRVAMAVLGATVELVRLAGGQEPVAIIGDPAQLGSGSKVPS